MSFRMNVIFIRNDIGGGKKVYFSSSFHTNAAAP
jgi:hypothetical protein